jgi:hypothetical protein
MEKAIVAVRVTPPQARQSVPTVLPKQKRGHILDATPFPFQSSSILPL